MSEEPRIPESLQSGQGTENLIAEARRWQDQDNRVLSEQCRTIVTLAAGTLALSITFLTDIAGPTSIWMLFFLSSAWFILLASIVAVLISYYYQRIVANLQAEIAKFQLDGLETADLEFELDKPARYVSVATNWALVLLIAGILVLATYVTIEMWRKLPCHETTTIQELHQESPSFVPSLDPQSQPMLLDSASKLPSDSMQNFQTEQETSQIDSLSK